MCISLEVSAANKLRSWGMIDEGRWNLAREMVIGYQILRTVPSVVSNASSEEHSRYGSNINVLIV